MVLFFYVPFVPFCGKNRLLFLLFRGANRGTMPGLAAPPVPTSAF